MLEEVYRRAFNYEKENRGCAQSVLAALQDVFNIRNDEVFRAASALSGGCGLTTHGTCGALSGAVMAMGMMFGRERSDFKDAEKKRLIAYGMARRMAEKFEARYGSVVCCEIQTNYLGRNFDLWSSADYVHFDKIAYQKEMCPMLVGTAAIWAAEIILDELEKDRSLQPPP